jgi:hypothetical protein
MKNSFMIVYFLAIVFGCGSQTPQPSEHTVSSGKYDGKYRYEDRVITMTMNIKSNVIKGYLRNNGWPGEIRMQINGKVMDDKFQIDYIHHPDVRAGFKMEVTNVGTSRIDGWPYDDSNKRYSWFMMKE